jgi:hypothetical protein
MQQQFTVAEIRKTCLAWAQVAAAAVRFADVARPWEDLRAYWVHMPHR